MRSDEATFSEIVRQYQQPLYWYIRRVAVVHEDAEDILQETFCKAFRKLWTLRSDSALKPWLFRIATNELRRYFKKFRPESADIQELSVASLLTTEDDDILLKSAENKLAAAISKLSLLQREVFCMKYYEDMDYEQISIITGKNKNTLMVSYHQAKDRIKREIL